MTNQPIRIGYNRMAALGPAALFGVIVIFGAKRSIEAANAVGVLIILVVIGPLFVLFAARVFRRRPTIVLDNRGIIVGRSSEIIPWESIFEARLLERQGVVVFHKLMLTVQHQGEGESHGDESVTTLTTSKVAVQTVEISLDQLSMSWGDIMALVQERLGKHIPSKRVGPFEKSIM